MTLEEIKPGKLPPKKMNAIIEVPENGFVKYEIDKAIRDLQNAGFISVRVINISGQNRTYIKLNTPNIRNLMTKYKNSNVEETSGLQEEIGNGNEQYQNSNVEQENLEGSKLKKVNRINNNINNYVNNKEEDIEEITPTTTNSLENTEGINTPATAVAPVQFLSNSQKVYEHKPVQNEGGRAATDRVPELLKFIDTHKLFVENPDLQHSLRRWVEKARPQIDVESLQQKISTVLNYSKYKSRSTGKEEYNYKYACQLIDRATEGNQKTGQSWQNFVFPETKKYSETLPKIKNYTI